MTYTWTFSVGGRSATARGKKCHRGPMIPVEQKLQQPFTRLVALDKIRKTVLNLIVDTELPAVQSREIVLRALYAPVGAMFPELKQDKADLSVLICEKRNSIEIDGDLSSLYPFFVASIPEYRAVGLPKQHEALLYDALNSSSAIYRVAGACASLLMAAYVELGS